MRLAVLFAATACIGLVAAADGVSRKAVSSPDVDPLQANGMSQSGALGPAERGHERFRYRHGATYAVIDGTTPLACQISCGDDDACHAWSFVEAYGGAPARCELKRGGGKSEENLLATSGVSPRTDAALWGVTTLEAAPAVTLEGEAPAEDPAPEIDGN
ncbi:MAG: hypothetical protein IPK75_00500 [Acidobacteria bacterium]|jgi:hypothetical protein|nr:hypothetical protein [Acidobacteriota bacterium]